MPNKTLINVTCVPTSMHFKLQDGYLKCDHQNAEVEAPCCSLIGLVECGCDGMYSVYCGDCSNSHMTDDDIEYLISLRP